MATKVIHLASVVPNSLEEALMEIMIHIDIEAMLETAIASEATWKTTYSIL